MKDFSSKVNCYKETNGVYWSNCMWLDNFGVSDIDETVIKQPVTVTKDTITPIPQRYQPTKDSYCTNWRSEIDFKENYPVSCQLGFDTNTKDMLDNGWVITLEHNRATKRHKLCFRHDNSGLMVRVPFAFEDKYIDIPMFYAVTNYRLVAAKFTEMFTDVTEDLIPDILDWIREVKKNKVSDYVCKQAKELPKQVDDFGKYLHNQEAA